MGKWGVLTGWQQHQWGLPVGRFFSQALGKEGFPQAESVGQGGGRGPNTGRWWVKTDSGRQIWAQPACKALTFAPPPPQPELLLQGGQSHLENVTAVGGPVGSPDPEVFVGGHTVAALAPGCTPEVRSPSSFSRPDLLPQPTSILIS